MTEQRYLPIPVLNFFAELWSDGSIMKLAPNYFSTGQRKIKFSMKLL